MPTASRRPVVVELRPSTNTSNMAPASPSKTVRFPEPAEIIAGVSRPLTVTEAWSLYYFETHASNCRVCFDPYRVISKGGKLCDLGRDLAHDVKQHVYHKDGQVYSTSKEDERNVRVEIPPNYRCLTGLLKARSMRASKSRPAPIIDYDTRSAPSVQPVRDWIPTYVTTSESQHRARQRPTRYNTIIVGPEQYDVTRFASLDEKKGSLYEKDTTATPQKQYRIEVLEPTDERRRRRRHAFYD